MSQVIPPNNLFWVLFFLNYGFRYKYLGIFGLRAVELLQLESGLQVSENVKKKKNGGVRTILSLM